ncbi:MAG TPA: hypothetical protein VFI52_09400 [Gemmatimonadaceae bacterium]|nr:hypothetical protein [Gemmatimonadaceae bacterium]
MTTIVRIGLFALALVLFVAGTGLGYIAVVAVRRNEGVFMPAGYVALVCMAGATYLLRLGLRG